MWDVLCVDSIYFWLVSEIKKESGLWKRWGGKGLQEERK